jgi:hypothetical protein
VNWNGTWEGVLGYEVPDLKNTDDHAQVSVETHGPLACGGCPNPLPTWSHYITDDYAAIYLGPTSNSGDLFPWYNSYFNSTSEYAYPTYKVVFQDGYANMIVYST